MSPPSDAAAKTVLVVEDHDDLRELYSYWLLHEGFDVLTAKDGADALQIIEGCVPDILVIDVHLQTVEGVSALEEISEDARACQIPVVAITAVDTERVPSNVITVVCKPVAEAQLIRAVCAAAALRAAD